MSEAELILAKLKIVSETEERGMYLCDKEHSKILLDYITNLQEENERLRKELLSKPDNEITLETKDGQILTIIQSERIDMQEKLNKSLEEMYKKYNDYKSRNEKAIEYIEEKEYIDYNPTLDGSEDDSYNILPRSLSLYNEELDRLLNILQGVDKE